MVSTHAFVQHVSASTLCHQHAVAYQLPLSKTVPSMAKFDGEKWVPESDAEDPTSGYGIARTILRHGPTPALRRIFQPAQYEQAVLKFMAQEGCDRNVAQGNMDYYFRNPNDWFALRLREKEMGIKYDLVSVDSTKTGLVVVWSVLLALFTQQFVSRVQSGEIDFVSGIVSNQYLLF